MPISSSGIDLSVIQEFFISDVLTNNDQLTMNYYDRDAPYLEIITQPCEKFRFRYYSEPGSHGVINGKSKDGKSQKKIFPTVRLVDPSKSVRRPVIIRARLFTADEPPRPHVLNCLHKQNIGKNQDGAYYEELRPDKTVQFKNLGIFILKRDEILSALQLRKMQELNIPNLNQQQEESVTDELRTYNLNETKLCFEAIYKDDMTPVECSPVFSDPIYNSKAAATGDLKICRLSLFKGSISGEEDMIILCDKIKKDDIEIRFFAKDGSWEKKAKFNQNDVHHQVAIPFKTPKYDGSCKESNIEVLVQLIRKSDLKHGDPVLFVYKNENYPNPKKRRLIEDFDFDCSDLLNIDFLNEFDKNQSLILELEDSSEFSSGTSDTTSSVRNDIVLKDAVNASESLLNENTDVDEISNRFSSFSLNNSNAEEEPNTVKKFLQCFSKTVHSLLKDKEVFYYTPSSLSVQDSEGNSILHLAIVAKQSLKFTEAVLKLIKEDLVNHKNLDLKTPLHLATQQGNATLLKLLLKNGGNPYLTDKQGNSCLHIAVIKGFSKCLETVFAYSSTEINEYSYKIDAENDDGLTPLHLAILKNCKDSFHVLIANNADVNKTEKKGGKSSLHLAVDEKSPFLETILSQEDIDIYCRDYSGLTALELACIKNNISFEHISEELMDNKESLLLYLKETLEIKNDISSTPANLEVEHRKLQMAVENILNSSSNWKKLGQLIEFSEEKLNNLIELEENPAGCLIEKIMEEKQLNLKEIIRRAGLAHLVSDIPGW